MARRGLNWAVGLAASLLLGTIPAVGRDVYVLISGGDSPFDNNYSQYLQARAVAHYFERHCPPDAVWIFFGAGNVEGETPVLSDVYRQVRREGHVVDTWLAGSLRRNRPARRDTILRALREEILPEVAQGGTLYLFVGDHGSRPEGDDEESLITLWGLERDEESDRGWRTGGNATLGVTALRRVLDRGLGKGQAVFVMTQCHSGGFHYLAVPRAHRANPDWFTSAPDWAKERTGETFPRVAGFTATDEYSAAAGCDPAADPVNWVGYERYFPEELFGCDMFTLESVRKPRRSFAEAHAAAAVVDRTMDKPYATSEQYLERWAELIEGRLSDSPDVTPKTKRALANYHRILDGKSMVVWNRDFRRYREELGGFVEVMAAQLPAHGGALTDGSLEALKRIIDPPDEREVRDDSNEENEDEAPRPRRRRGGSGRGLRTVWNETLRPAWQNAVEAGDVSHLLGEAADFERHLLESETDRRNFFFPNTRSRLQEEVYWHSGHGRPATMNTARAEAAALWCAVRRSAILEWAKQSDDESLRAAAGRLDSGGGSTERSVEASDGVSARERPIDAETAAARALFYRRALAAWSFLLEMNEREALARLRELRELERTPLPIRFD